MSDPGDNSIAAVLPPQRLELDLDCAGCERHSQVFAIVSLDWRNRSALEAAVSTCTHFNCVHCGRPITRTNPLLLVRPGDPIALIGAIPTAGDLDSQARQLAGLIRGKVASTVGGADATFQPINADDFPDVAGRYLGFDLVDRPQPGQRPVEWLKSALSNLDLPDPVDALNRFITARSAEAGDEVIGIEPVLLDSAWAPVIDRLVEELEAAQPDDDTREIVRRRFRRIEQRRLLGAVDDNGLLADEAARRALNDLEMPAPGGNREPLEAVVDLLGRSPDNVLYAAGLISLTASQLRDPRRTSEDLELAVDTARNALDVARRVFGGTHEAALSAQINLAVALGDRADSESVLEGESLLAAALPVAVEGASSRLVDVVMNLGALSSADHRPGSRSDRQERALELFQDAEHLARLLAPGRRDKAMSAVANQAAIYRSRIIGDPVANVHIAVERYDTALEFTPETDVPPAEWLLLKVNRANAEFALLQHLPETVKADEVARDLIALAGELQNQLAHDHPVRLTHLANIAAMVGDLYSDSVRAGRPRAGLLTRALELSETVVADHLAHYGPTHRETARVLNNKAAHLARPTADATELHDGSGAITIGNELLGWVTDDDMADLRASIATNLARVHVARNDWRQAVDALAIAVESHNALYRAATSRPARFGERLAAGQTLHRLAFAQVRIRQVRAAVSSIETARQDFASPQQAEREKRPQSDRALVYTGICSFGTYIILKRPGAAPTGVLTDLTVSDLAAPLNALNAATSHRERQDALDALTPTLGGGLATPVALMLDAHPEIAALSVVAGGLLTAAPLHTIPLADGSCWLDRWRIRYVLNASELQSPIDASEERVTVGVVDPTGDLTSGATEVDALTGWDQRAVIAERGAGRGWLRDQLALATHLHLACHARNLPQDPWGSGFDLGDPALFSTADLLESDLSGVRLVVAPACGTGQVAGGAPDELLGIGYAMLHAGAGQIVTSLWNVDDLATALIIHNFYENLTKSAPESALRSAQLWLRQLTVTELTEIAHTPGAVGGHLRSELHRRRHLRDWRQGRSTPFASVDYWGGLALLSNQA